MSEVPEASASETLADDILEGAAAAAAYTGFKLRTIFHMVENAQIPHKRAGRKLIFRKSELNRHFSGNQAAA